MAVAPAFTADAAVCDWLPAWAGVGVGAMEALALIHGCCKTPASGKRLLGSWRNNCKTKITKIRLNFILHDHFPFTIIILNGHLCCKSSPI